MVSSGANSGALALALATSVSALVAAERSNQIEGSLNWSELLGLPNQPAPWGSKPKPYYLFQTGPSRPRLAHGLCEDSSALVAQAGELVSGICGSTSALANLAADLDLGLVLVEVLGIIMVASAVSGLFASSKRAQAAYAETVTFFKANNISVAEVGVVFTLVVGLILFDVFVAVTEEDLADVVAYLVLALVVAVFVLVALAADVQYYYMISSISGGELLARVVASDVVNNGLCVLRVFFC